MRRQAIPAALSLALLIAGPAPLAARQASLARPALWATAVSGTSVANLYRIEPDLYRSAQPTASGFRELEALGVKSVLDVAGGEGDDLFTRGTKLKLFHVPMTAFSLRDDRVLEALRFLVDPANRPVVIHCQHGADRTGAFVALYRVAVQGWTPEAAIREMEEGGYHHSFLWRNLDRYVLRADIDSLRRKLGIALAGAAPLPAPAILNASSSSAADAGANP
jgi:protein tyrosine phosphatase (PTP) superfamily phosphohydrolase (DUF442 family)